MRVSSARDLGDISVVYRKVAELHADSIDQGFLSSLGAGVLSQLYRAIDESEGGVLFVASDGERIAGFVSGGIGMGRIYRRMLVRAPMLVPLLLPRLLRRRTLRGLLEVVRHGLRHEKKIWGLPPAELLSLAVAPEFRGQGIADDLFRSLARRFAGDGHAEFRIVVGEALAPAHRFYRRMGARPAARLEVHAGRESVVYVQSTSVPRGP